MEKYYTKDQIIGFKESDWEFRRSSGFSGYDHKDHPGNEQKWIYEADFNRRKILRDEYEKAFKLLYDFRLEQLPLGQVPDYHIHDFLDKQNISPFLLTTF